MIRSSSARNLAFVYVYYVCRYALPIVIVGALTRHFDPTSLTALLTGQSVSAMGAQIIEYGFGLAGPRDVAAALDGQGRATVVSSIASAQLMLFVPSALVCLMLSAASPVLHVWSAETAPICAYALVSGVGPGWYFQGSGRAQLAAVLEGAGQLVALGLLLTGLRHQIGPVGALCAMAAGPALSSVVGWIVILREAPVALSRRAGTRALSGGVALFLTRASLTSYTAASTWLMTLFAGPLEVARFAPALRVASGAAGAFTPLAQVMLPVVVRLEARGAGLDATLVRLGAALAGGGVAAAVALCLTASIASRLIFGVSAPAASLSVLAAMLAPIAISQFVGTYVLIPGRKDRWLAASVVAGALANIGLAAALARPFGAVGMAAARVGSETIVAGVQILSALPTLARLGASLVRRPSPWPRQADPPSEFVS